VPFIHGKWALPIETIGFHLLMPFIHGKWALPNLLFWLTRTTNMASIMDANTASIAGRLTATNNASST